MRKKQDKTKQKLKYFGIIYAAHSSKSQKSQLLSSEKCEHWKNPCQMHVKIKSEGASENFECGGQKRRQKQKKDKET